jgi:cell division transport system permease protein
LKYVIDTNVAPLLTFTKFFEWQQVWISSAILLGVGLFVSIVASAITLRRYLKV